jgi:hypothetical protein
MTAIAELVTLLLSTGIPPESVSAAVDLAQRHAVETAEFHRNSTGIPPETTSEKRKAWDRERKRKIAETKKSPLILPSSLLTEETLKKERKKESSGIRARARLVPLPDDWKPSEHAFEVAEKHGSSVSDTEPIFRDYLKSSGKRYADYDAAFYNFLRNQRKFNGNGPSKTPSGGSLIASIDRELSELRGEKSANFELPEGNIRRLSHGPVR